MEGIRHPSPSDGNLKVGRDFEWSRLESELMTSAYEHVLYGRSARANALQAGQEFGRNGFGGCSGGRQRYAAGA